MGTLFPWALGNLDLTSEGRLSTTLLMKWNITQLAGLMISNISVWENRCLKRKLSWTFLREHWRCCHLHVCVERERKGWKYEETGPHLSSTFLPWLGWWGTILRRPVRATVVWYWLALSMAVTKAFLHWVVGSGGTWYKSGWGCLGQDPSVCRVGAILLGSQQLPNSCYRKVSSFWGPRSKVSLRVQATNLLKSRESTPADSSSPCGPLSCWSHDLTLTSQAGREQNTQSICFIDGVHLLVAN